MTWRWFGRAMVQKLFGSGSTSLRCSLAVTRRAKIFGIFFACGQVPTANSPCLAAIATMAQQMQSKKWFWFAILFQNVFAYLVTLCVYQIGTLVTGGGFGVGTAVAFVVVAVMLFLLFRPDPYKDQKVYSKRSVNA